ncbi:DUF7935 family protein [Ornithobacterium rhinotracheale]|uniref:DUF7935 family protein n=1 Tax=Ornithobacterium rhinotracheale TaxID=28251 RepID=UPI003FA43602
MEIIRMLLYLVPMLFLGGIFYLLIDKYFSAQKLQTPQNVKNDEITSHRLQAYERMALFLERIRPTNLVRRIELSNSLEEYEYALVHSIQEEYDHNLSQQIYILPDTWKIIFSTKNATQNFIKQCKDTLKPNASAEDLQTMILKKSMEGSEPSSGALLQLQSDVQSGFRDL